MKKRTVFLLILSMIVLVGVLAGCDQPAAEPVRTEYEISVTVEEDAIVCSQKTTFVNEVADTLDHLTFAVYPYAYTKNAEHKAYVGELPRYADVEIKSWTVNGVQTEGAEGTDFVTIPVALNRGQTVVVETEYAVTLPECALRFGKKDGYYNLSNFYPQIAVYEGEDFRTDPFTTVGDPVYSDPANFSLTVDLPENLVAALPFESTENAGENGRKILSVRGENVRDFAFVLKEGYRVFSSDADGVQVRYFTTKEDGQSHCDLAADALATFAKHFGKYPYSAYTVTETPFDPDGMEFSGLVYIAVDSSDVEKTIVHETAHQWFYNLVGNDNINSPFLDEGLTTFVTEYYYLLNGDEQKFNEGMEEIKRAYARYERLQNMRGEKSGLDMTQSIYSYTEYRYVMLVYDKAALLFDALYRLGGKEKFNASIRTYVANNRFCRADKRNLIAAFSSGMSNDVGGFIDGWLSEGAVVATFAA